MVRVEVRHDNMADDSPYAEALKWPGFTQGYNFPCETHFIVHLTLLFFVGKDFARRICCRINWILQDILFDI